MVVKKIFSLLALVWMSMLFLWGQHAHLIWESQSRNSSESMPCGGGDIGLNVWVEGDELFFYMSRSGTFDRHNTQLKQGRVRMAFTPDFFNGNTEFSQELKPEEGHIEITTAAGTIELWVDVFKPVIHVEVKSKQAVKAEVFYENWRYRDRLIRKGEGQQNSWKWAPPEGSLTAADGIEPGDKSILFYHRNPQETIFDWTVRQQGLEEVKERMMNPLAHLTFGGMLWGDNLRYRGTRDGEYAGTDFKAWCYESVKPARNHHIKIALHTQQTEDMALWEQELRRTVAAVSAADKKRSREWWKAFHNRSYIIGSGESTEITRNYMLFRYMLGCNAYGSVPTKFNGGLFTFDPVFVDEKQAFTPDYRKWGGGTMTAQNQRLVYWPMLKAGDFDMMDAQFEFYNQMLGNTELRSEVYWGHGGACFGEQIENFGLPNPAEYGFKRPDYFDKGVEYNAWLEYEWDTVLEFCQMILDRNVYNGDDITPYIPLIESSLRFFEEHYEYLASRRGRKSLDGEGHLILFPGSACETYKMTNNASSTIAALRVVLESYGQMPEMLTKIPPLPLRELEGRTMISPAKTWERINNVETPQLYPVYPWRIYGVGRPDLEIARNTYLYDPDALEFRIHIGWKQDNIWAACLGLTEEAYRLTSLKLGDGPHRFPAFWGPGYDWTPDHNWGGSGMIGLQEMLLQTNGDEILLFPAWPQDKDIRFKLHAPGNTVVEAELRDGEVIDLKVFPKSRRKDIVMNTSYIKR